MLIFGLMSDFKLFRSRIATSGILLVVVCASIGLSVLTTSCRSRKNDTGAVIEGQASDTILVAISRGPCFGRCPEYKAIVTKKGAAYYAGKRNVAKPGLWYASLPADQLSALVTEIRTSELESRDTLYVNRYLADFPDCDIWVSDKLPLKHIHINHEAPPEELAAFSKYLDALLNSLVWEPVDPQPEDTDR